MKTKNNETELRNPKTWDFERARIVKPATPARVVVSVAMNHADFDIIAKQAEIAGKKLSEYIRDAAVEKAGGKACGMAAIGTGSLGAMWASDHMPTYTAVSSGEPSTKEKDDTRTY